MHNMTPDTQVMRILNIIKRKLANNLLILQPYTEVNVFGVIRSL